MSYTLYIGAQPVITGLHGPSAVEVLHEQLRWIGPAFHPRLYGDAVFAYLRLDGEEEPISVLPDQLVELIGRIAA